MKKWIKSIVFCIASISCGAAAADTSSSSEDELISGHMVAQAMLTAHFLDAALKADMSKEEINAVLKRIAENSAISEFWISDGDGQVEFTNFPEIQFAFPMDPSAASQAAPFANLISGGKNTVVQPFMERELDQKLYKYVGVAGVDKPRIVQVGVKASQME